jgi:rubredoxin
MKLDKNIKSCPSCGSEEYYIKQKYEGTCNYVLRFDGLDSQNNCDMHASARYENTSKYAYCNKCKKRLFKIEG